MSDEVFFSPRLTAHDQRRTFPIAPLEYHAAAVERTIETAGAVRHAQPAARGGIERKVLAEHMGARGITVSDRVIGSRERHPHMRTGCPGRSRLRGRRGGGPASLSAARHAAGLAPHAA